MKEQQQYVQREQLNLALATLTLCCVMFAHSYLLISVFPYSGFMAMQLLPGIANPQNVGSFAGLISAAFMIGRALSSYTWGYCADKYGRIFTLVLSLSLSGITTTLFGLSQNFGEALLWRFALGLSNGLISTTKVLVSEICGQDKAKEAKIMNIVMSMWGGAFLIAPAISGALAEPLQQYPSLLEGLHHHLAVYNLLSKYPFVLPNLVGLLICLISIMCVKFSIQETLPAHKLRSPKNLPADIQRAGCECWQTAIGLLRSACIFGNKPSQSSSKHNTYGGVSEQTPLAAATNSSGIPRNTGYYGVGDDGTDECCFPPMTDVDDEEVGDVDVEDTRNGTSDATVPDDVIALIEKDVEDAIRSSQLYSNYYTATNAIATGRARNSIVAAVRRKCRCPPGREGCCCVVSGVGGIEALERIQEEKNNRQQKQMRVRSDQPEELELPRRSSIQRKRLSLPPATMLSLWRNTKAKNLMLVHWFGSFLMVALDEAFPLFCLSPLQGLGLQENSIGQILSVSGIIFLVLQLMFYPPIVDRLGLFGSMVFGCAAMPPLTFLIPVSLILNRIGGNSSHSTFDAGGGGGDLTWAAFLFLTIDMAFARAADLTFFTGITVAINSQVPPAHRGTLNGLNNLGGSIAQAMGPIFAGLLVAFSFSSGLFSDGTSSSTAFGALFLFGTIAVLNTFTAVAAYRLLREDEENEKSIDFKM